MSFYYLLSDVNENVDIKNQKDRNILQIILDACYFKVLLYILLLIYVFELPICLF